MQVVWGSYFLITKGLQTEINVYLLHFSRFALLTIILLPFAGREIRNKKLIAGGIFAGALLAASNYLLNLGLNLSTSVNAAFLVGTTTIFVTLYEILFFKAKMSKGRIIAAVLATAGMWLITGGLGKLDIGDIVLILSSMIGAFHVICSDRNLDSKVNVLSFVFWQMLVCAVIGFFLTTFYGNFHLPELNAGNIGAFLYIALISMGLGLIVQMWTQGRANPIVVSIIVLFQSIIGAVIGWTLGNEEFVLTQAIGGLIIVAGMFLSVISDKDADLKSID